MTEVAEEILRRAVRFVDCLISTATPSQAYPMVMRRGLSDRPIAAARVVWAWSHEQPLPPPDMAVVHTCYTPGCVEPAHLVLIPVEDAVTRRRDRTGTDGHRAAAATTAARRLTPDDVRRMVVLHEQGRSPAEIAAEMDVSRSTVLRRLRRAGIDLASATDAPHPPAIDKAESAIRAHEDGRSVPEIAARLKVSHAQVRRWLHAAGVTSENTPFHSITDAERDQVRADFDAGATLHEIAAAHDRPVAWARAALGRTARPSPGQPQLTPELVAAVTADYRDGLNLNRLADLYGLTRDQVRGIARAAGPPPASLEQEQALRAAAQRRWVDGWTEEDIAAFLRRSRAWVRAAIYGVDDGFT